MLYEDDGLRALRALTGLPVAEAYRLHKRALKHRTEEEGRALAREFERLCAARGVAAELAAEQWAQLLRFRHYAFCKSHAVSYGLIAWTAAWLKVRQPLCFWTAVLNNAQGMYPRRVYVEAARRAGIPLHLPCVNRSAEVFRPEGAGIRTGLGVIATLPEELRGRLLIERAEGGPYRDLADLRRRVQPGPEALAVLIRCGALDFTGLPRPRLFLEAELQDRWEQQCRGAGLAAPLFPAVDPALAEGWAPADYPALRRWRDEWDLLGFLVGPALMSLFRPHLPGGLHTSRDLAGRVGRWVHVAGLVAAGRNARTQDGREMQFITLEDEWGLIEVNLFPGTCPLLPHLELGPYVASGIVDDHLGVPALTAHRFRIPSPLAGIPGAPCGSAAWQVRITEEKGASPSNEEGPADVPPGLTPSCPAAPDLGATASACT
jgi:DNA polymerase-3 subunit alpha